MSPKMPFSEDNSIILTGVQVALERLRSYKKGQPSLGGSLASCLTLWFLLMSSHCDDIVRRVLLRGSGDGGAPLGLSKPQIAS